MPSQQDLIQVFQKHKSIIEILRQKIQLAIATPENEKIFPQKTILEDHWLIEHYYAAMSQLEKGEENKKFVSPDIHLSAQPPVFNEMSPITGETLSDMPPYQVVITTFLSLIQYQEFYQACITYLSIGRSSFEPMSDNSSELGQVQGFFQDLREKTGLAFSEGFQNADKRRRPHALVKPLLESDEEHEEEFDESSDHNDNNFLSFPSRSEEQEQNEIFNANLNNSSFSYFPDRIEKHEPKEIFNANSNNNSSSSFSFQTKNQETTILNDSSSNQFSVNWGNLEEKNEDAEVIANTKPFFQPNPLFLARKQPNHPSCLEKTAKIAVGATAGVATAAVAIGLLKYFSTFAMTTAAVGTALGPIAAAVAATLLLLSAVVVGSAIAAVTTYGLFAARDKINCKSDDTLSLNHHFELR